MTKHFGRVIVISGNKKGPQVRKGKAMLQISAQSKKRIYGPYDLQGTILPSFRKNEWISAACLHKTGSSGYLGPGAFMRILV